MYFSCRLLLNNAILVVALQAVTLSAVASEPHANPSTLTEFKISASELEALQQKALAGDGDAANRVYEHYYLAKLDYPAGEFWLKICAENGNSSCQYNLGFIMSGSKDDKDKARGIFWLRRAEKSGVKEASDLIKERY